MPPPLRLNDARSPLVQDQGARTPSPNYFGLTIDSSADVFSSSAAQHARANWSPPTSNVRSAAAASPRVIPVDHNPEYEAFKKQAEENKPFSFGGLSQFSINLPNVPMNLSSPPGSGSRPVKKPGDVASPSHTGTPGSPQSAESNGSLLSPGKPRSPKRMLSSDSNVFPNRARRHSPATFEDLESDGNDPPRFADNRPSLPAPLARNISSQSGHHRAETLPVNFDGDAQGRGDPIMVTPQHVVNLIESSEDEILLLDLRVSTQYAASRIRGALSLCIPTTLLKRESFNVEKLADTFSDKESKSKFLNWKSSKYIIVYDASSSQLKDAVSCINTLRKFAYEGWRGASYVIRGGLTEFSAKFPKFIVNGKQETGGVRKKPNLKLGGMPGMPGPAPVIGGCPMPATQNAANPFFGNIRQNMDLIGGVGQMPVKRPAAMSQTTEAEIPAWLRDASEEKDNGATVADKFLHIEKREQKRMQDALSGKVVYGNPGPGEQKNGIQIAGIEKGTKNRYNNIWPFEHTRVKLQDVPTEGCDYFNANHIRPPWSNKRYIATQGPIPVTFADFWNVIWQQDVRVIVMLTAEKEGGQVKAHNYWGEQQYGDFRLNFHTEHRASLEPDDIKRHHQKSAMRRQSTQHDGPGSMQSQPVVQPEIIPSPNSDVPYVIVRKFTLSNTRLPFERMREITQLQYSNWPDFGAPAHPAHLLGLVEQCDAVVRQIEGGSFDGPDESKGRPVLVHCSAGCGRTGTFCTVDSVIDMLKRQRVTRSERQATPMDLDSKPTPSKKDDNPFFGYDVTDTSGDNDDTWVSRDDIDLIEKTVETFRNQRLSMVQSLRQFVLCYESVLEWLQQQRQ
ncbi:uncharacterized protein K452DRAFT_221764 [Aplosporella prunicola CBS 121167]|uniref:protein-tyrosine-phosphatase n=1 Tax=Aplosporella prunicola CBS 121167 TaxID=1176127 RepID=A0A6A6BLD9_9PEZI|nr:uncharacterized protein K452DRAFT_221764 [Aplosporella prunicola CBS 121167]KAF2144930.1 hypothetical protein K452DRAFT_221764 [Aplosporella prunicola CBS 121167]